MVYCDLHRWWLASHNFGTIFPIVRELAYHCNPPPVLSSEMEMSVTVVHEARGVRGTVCQFKNRRKHLALSSRTFARFIGYKVDALALMIRFFTDGKIWRFAELEDLMRRMKEWGSPTKYVRGCDIDLWTNNIQPGFYTPLWGDDYVYITVGIQNHEQMYRKIIGVQRPVDVGACNWNLSVITVASRRFYAYLYEGSGAGTRDVRAVSVVSAFGTTLIYRALAREVSRLGRVTLLPDVSMKSIGHITFKDVEVGNQWCDESLNYNSSSFY